MTAGATESPVVRDGVRHPTSPGVEPAELGSRGGRRSGIVAAVSARWPPRGADGAAEHRGSWGLMADGKDSPCAQSRPAGVPVR